VSVFNPSPGGGSSTPLVFSTYLPLPANDLVYSAAKQLLYASVPSDGGLSLGNSIVSIDPYTGVLGLPIYVGSEPGKMTISSDGTVIWVALNGAAAVRKVDLNSQSAGLQFTLGGGTGIYNPPQSARALTVMPGQPNTVAVALSTSNTYSSLVTIYDNGVPRTNAVNGAVQCCSGVTGLAFDSTGTKLYEAGSGYGLATVDSTGITSATALNTSIYTNDLRVDNGRAYLTNGVVLDANLGTQLGVFSVAANQNANGPVAPDSVIGEAFILVNPSFGSSFQINGYDLSTFVLKGSIPIGGVNSFPQNPSSLTRWGQDGLAFTTGTQVYIFRSSLVRDLSKTLADVNVVAISAPANATTGTNLTYSFKVGNVGPSTATPVTFIDNLPNGSTFQNVMTSQGTCAGGSVVYCNLGNLISGGSATVQITLTPLNSGTLTNIATVAAPQGDPNPANNTVSSGTVVTGSSYNAAPAITSISPEFVQAGSAAFTLAVNGFGFSSNSTVQLNSTPLATTFVNANQLTATVPASDVASMGWSWINVSSPTPGGGTSSRWPLTAYQIISLDTNRMIFDPFTRKLYATVPSTATQVAGNSLVAIDPAAGTLGTPLTIGSGPNRIAESSDGKYVYIGLDGALSLRLVDLPSMTQGPIYPLTLPGSTPPTQFAARDLAVAPGNDNLLAIDTGSWGGIGLFDISGSSGTMRSHLTGPYTGSNLTFANATTVYSYDSDTTGAEFNRWTAGSTGLTLNDNTGYTLNGIGGFAGAFKLVNGLIYGFAGGVADPAPTPPVQLGQFTVNSAQGAGQSIQGAGVAPDPTIGRVFFLGETLAGSANPVLMSFDSNKYVLLDIQQFTGSIQGVDLLRWGRDGLAWHTSNNGAFGNSTPGSGQVFLMRSPFVLPQWGAVNPTPGLVSASPSSAAAGSGNLTLTITGSNFVPGAVLLWNGAERTTTFVDSSRLTTAIPASDLAKSGTTATLMVNNPGSSNSGSISFTIN
jgi:trimeric autotransporter adhesin